MPKFTIGNMWEVSHSIYCIPTNAVITRTGLVMGAGVALQAVKRYSPTLKAVAAAHIRKSGQPDSYGFIPLAPQFPHVALFQTKGHWRGPSTLEHIQLSTTMLAEFANRNENSNIALPFPGIGYGGLKPADVQPILQELPDNVTVYTLPQRKDMN